MGRENRGLLVVLGVLVLLVVIGPILGAGMMGPGMMGPGMPGGTMPGGSPGWVWGLAMGLGGLAMLAFWGAVIVGVVLLVRWLASATDGSSGGRPESALDVLKRRYAAGEITRQEFEDMRRVLEA